MELKSLFENYWLLDNELVLMFYKGAMSQETMIDLGSFLRSTLCGSKKIKKIFSIFVEMFHNIRHYSAERRLMDKGHGEVGVGLFMIRETPEMYLLMCGNPVDDQDVPKIRERIETLIGLDREALRDHYKHCLRSGEQRHPKGAGLGLIEIAKRADLPLEYTFHPNNGKSKIFSLTAKIYKH